jgi:type III secretory pathway component EscS
MEYYIKEVERIVGILVAMIQAAKSPQSQPHAA